MLVLSRRPDRFLQLLLPWTAQLCPQNCQDRFSTGTSLTFTFSFPISASASTRLDSEVLAFASLVSLLLNSIFHRTRYRRRCTLHHRRRWSQRSWYILRWPTTGNPEGRIPHQTCAECSHRSRPLYPSLCAETVFSTLVLSHVSLASLAESDDVLQNLSMDKLYDLIRDQGILPCYAPLYLPYSPITKVTDYDPSSMKTIDYRRYLMIGAQSGTPSPECVIYLFLSHPPFISTTDLCPRVQLEDSPLARQTSFKWANYVKPQGSPTKPELIESPHPSPHRLEHDLSYNPTATPNLSRTAMMNGSSSLSQQSATLQTTAPLQPRRNGTIDNSLASTSAGGASVNANASGSTLAAPTPPKPVRQESTDNLKSFKVSLEDPAWKVLPAALRKYKINNDDWQNYAMFICYGPPSAFKAAHTIKYHYSQADLSVQVLG